MDGALVFIMICVILMLPFFVGTIWDIHEDERRHLREWRKNRAKHGFGRDA